MEAREGGQRAARFDRVVTVVQADDDDLAGPADRRRESGLVPADRPAGLQVCQLGQPPFDDEVVQRAAVVEEFQAVSRYPRDAVAGLRDQHCLLRIRPVTWSTTRSGSLGQVSPRQATMPSGRTSAKAFLYVSRARPEAIHSTSMGIRRLRNVSSSAPQSGAGAKFSSVKRPRKRSSTERPSGKATWGARCPGRAVGTYFSGSTGGSGVLSEMTNDDSG